MTNEAPSKPSPPIVLAGGLADDERLLVDGDPTDAELEAIEAEWPLTAAELALVDAEVLAASDPTSAIAVAAVTTARLRLAAVEESYHPIHFLEVS